MKKLFFALLAGACLLLPTCLFAQDIASCGQTCPPGPCECAPPPAISENGSGFTVEGGKPDFTWSACGDYTVSEDTRALTVTDSSKCCGAGAVAVTDACNRVAKKPVEFTRDLELIQDTTNTNVWTVVQASTMPLTWDFCGTLDLSADTRTATITSTADCCGTYKIKVRGACNEEAEKVAGTVPALSVAGPEDAIVGSDYNAGGGSHPYTWSFSKGSIDANGTITSISGCNLPGEIRTGIITVTDACGTSVSKDVRLPGGRWQVVSQSTPYAAPPWPENYISQTITEGMVRSTYYYTGCDCFYARQMFWSPGGCMGFNYYSNDGQEPPGAVQYESSEICGEKPPNPWTNLEGTIYRYGVSSAPGWCDAWKNQYQIFGWRSYCKNHNYFTVENWVCR